MKKHKLSCAITVFAITTALLSVGFGKKERPIEEFMQIAVAGAGLVIDASGKTPEDLMRIAAVARARGHSFYLKNCGGFTTADLQRIAVVGRGLVVMEF